MPTVEVIFAKLGKAKFFTTLDLRSGYHHIALDEETIKKTAFVTPLGKYEYFKVPFGLAQAPAYLDDIIIFSETPEQHLKHIQIVLTRLKQAKLSLKKSKCSFSGKNFIILATYSPQMVSNLKQKNKSNF